MTTVAFERAPHNFVNPELIKDLANALFALDEDVNCRVVVLTSRGKNYCAGADFGNESDEGGMVDPAAVYREAMRLFDTQKPIVTAVQGAAVGAGAGLALVADFRVASNDCRFSFNFNRLGIHPGFGLSHTLPRLIGLQMATLLFYTGRRVNAEQALAMGLVDELVADDQLLVRAQALAAEIAASAPLAVQSTRASLRQGLAEQVRAANQHELAEQKIHFSSLDFQEGVQAMAQRRLPVFQGR